MELVDYIPLAVVMGLAGVMALAIAVVGGSLGPRRPSEVKSSTFECGSDPAPGSARQRFAVKFYVVALLFIVFDLESVFLYPWAVNFRSLGWFGYGEMAVFAVTLVVGLVYILKKGALHWEQES
jgi:NADH-quinone oxidoreductase subunit A